MQIPKNDRGFGVVEALLVLVIVGILAFTGWFVWNAKQNADKSLDTATASAQKQAEVKEAIAIPADWQWFISNDKTVKFAYPKTWGNLKEQTQKASDTSYDTSNYVQPLVITKKKDLLVQIPKSYADYTWYKWDTGNDNFVSALDTNPPGSESNDAYGAPNRLGPTKEIEPLESVSSKEHPVYEVLGRGAMNCGSHHYFFAIGDNIVHLSAALCDRDGEWQPQAGQGYVDDVEGPLAKLFSYIGD